MEIRSYQSAERCPVSGIWRCNSCQMATAVFAAGEPFPKLHGQSVKWRLVRSFAC